MTRSKIFCSAKNCYSYQQAPNAPKFFNFPKDLASRTQWAENAGRPDLITKPYASFIGRYFLCADHFEAKYFVCPKKKTLFKKNVNPIPTIFENNLNIVVPLKNSKPVEETNVASLSTVESNSAHDSDENIPPEARPAELSSVVTVQLTPDSNLLCNLDSTITIAATTPVEDSMEMECLMLCRLCASLIEISLLLPIFQDREEPSISQMIEQFLPGKVLLEDGLPQHICGPCIERLRICFESVDMFRSADSRLREMLQLCSLNDETLQSGETSLDSVILSTHNISSPTKEQTPVLDEASTVITTVGLLPIEEKTTEIAAEPKLPDHIVTVLDLDNEVGEFDSSTEDIADSNKEINLSRKSCGVCLKSFFTRQELFLHFVSAHTLVLNDTVDTDNVSFQCILCEALIPSKQDLKPHFSTHTPANLICVCNECDSRFKTWSQLKEHVRESHSKKVDLKLKEDGERKVGDTDEKSRLQCPECGKEFKNRTALKKHEGIHSSDRNVLCSLCGKVLANLNSLRVHMRTHTDDRPFSCQECGKSFKGSTELRSHAVTHTREKVFDCRECGRKFHSKSLVRQHMLSHTRDKPHKCNLCLAAFNRLGNLNQHKKKKHVYSRPVDIQVPHECTVCGKRFNSELTLKYHVAKHTGEKHPFDCGICGKTFIAIDPYRVHMRIHTGERPYECSVCKKTFRSSATLKQHAGLHRDDFPYACPFCQRSFKRLQSLIVHKKTHTGEKPYPCPLCARPFAQKGDMLKHTKTHRTQLEGESVVMEINSIHDLTLSESDITNEFLMSMPIVKVEMA